MNIKKAAKDSSLVVLGFAAFLVAVFGLFAFVAWINASAGLFLAIFTALVIAIIIGFGIALLIQWDDHKNGYDR